MEKNKGSNLTKQILLAMGAGIILGVIINILPQKELIDPYLTHGILDFGGKVFLNILKMLVVPIVFISLVCGTFNLDKSLSFGRIAAKTIFFYCLTTALAITIALFIAHSLGVGSASEVKQVAQPLTVKQIPSLKQTLLNIFPSNPVKALAEGNMLQIIVFAILFGIAITWAGKKGERVKQVFKSLDVVVNNLVNLVIRVAPYGVFCLVAKVFSTNGITVILQLTSYFLAVLLVLGLQFFGTYGFFIRICAGLNPITFYRKMFSAMLFAFSTSSSNASIPVVLDTVERKLGVKKSIASFVIPLGATINMDGTAIMQGVATVFIANTYHIHLGIIGFLKVILTATLASIGTAGVPSVGLITLMMVLMQVGLPVEGIALIIGIDRILDMVRTAVNVTGDAMVSCVIAKQEGQINADKFNYIPPQK